MDLEYPSPEMFKFCKAEIDGIVCTFIKSETIVEVRQQMQECYASGKTLPGTRSYHQISEVLTRRVSALLDDLSFFHQGL